ncbi:hypothetical protein AMELA_G00201880 [Ameiurus melas]|uniref:Uncharacterized protein n=1 Tax=Ameiurus melas TaxID=219545 RepID=A0A7J6A9K3_AMEME|nr:hypothetical protein AMELA_G00201880 [Ameiurus melas]
MAMRRMNEMCRRTALTLVFYVLLFHTCQGQNDTTVTNQDTTVTNQANSSTQPYSTQMTPRSSDDPSTITPTNKPTERPTTEGTTKGTLPKSTEPQTNTETEPTQPSKSQTTSEATTSQTTAENSEDDPKSSEDIDDTENDGPNETNVKLHQSPIYVNPTVHPQVTKQDEADGRRFPIFTSILVGGIILAAVLLGVYIWNSHCRTNANSMKLAEESYMAE